MKKVLKPVEPEEAVYFSDFSGKSLGKFDAPVEIDISFNYGSKFDGASLKIHLDDEEVKPLLKLIYDSVNVDYKKSLKNKKNKIEADYDASVQMRDWDACTMENNILNLLNYFLENKG